MSVGSRLVGLVGVMLAMSSCASGLVHPAHQHLVNGELVHSPAPGASSYASYIEAGLALEFGDHERARNLLRRAIAIHRSDPQLWTRLAEVELDLGNRQAAVVAVDRALMLAPRFPRALELEAKLERGGT